MNINRVLLTGNLTRDPHLAHTASGMAVCELALAINSREKRNDEWQDRVDFFDMVVFGNNAENAGNLLKKGTAIAVDGRLRLERWETKGGEKRQKVVVVIENWQFTNRKRDDGDGPTYEDAGSTFQAPSADFAAPQADFGGSGSSASGPDDDIPF